MTWRAVLVGAGGIGRYHLLGLLRVPGLSGVQVIEPNGAAVAAARQMVPVEDSRVSFVDSIAQCWRAPELTVVATQAEERPSVVRALLEHGHRTLLLEKMVCQSEADYRALRANVEAGGARCWVNSGLRYNAVFQEAAAVIQGQPVALSVVGSDVGLGTNAIHFAALFMALRGDWQVTWDGAHLDRRLLPNKRGAQLVEFGGLLSGRDPQGSVLSIANMPFDRPLQTIAISSEAAWWFVDVVGATAHRALRSDEWQVRSTSFLESRVSEVTTLAAVDILQTGTCRMPTLSELEGPHRSLFEVFRRHIESVTGSAPERVSIT